MFRGVAVVVVLVALSLVFVSCSGDRVTTSPVPEAVVAPSMNVVPPGATPAGKTYGEWAIAWWQWLWSAPVDVNPGLDETGEFVDYGQSGPVWFIAPNYGGVTDRSATIPAGKMLFVDVAADFESPLIDPSASEEDLRALCATIIDDIQMVEISVDGVSVDNLAAYRLATPRAFSYTLPENNMFEFFGIDAPAGTYGGAVADGYYVMLSPLPAGAHTIDIVTEWGFPYYSTDHATVHLTVSGRAASHHALKED